MTDNTKRLLTSPNVLTTDEEISVFKEYVFCKDTNLLRKGKARACESLGFVVNKNDFFSSISGKRNTRTSTIISEPTSPMPKVKS